MTTEQLRFEYQARDEALGLLIKYRSELIELARATAHRLAYNHGYVTAPMVRSDLEARGIRVAGPGLDPRWLGGVFMRGSGWRRIGWEATGSHGRPVAMWAR